MSLLLALVSAAVYTPCAGAAPPDQCQGATTPRERQCLVGQVQRVEITVARFTNEDGDWVERPAQFDMTHPSTKYDRDGQVLSKTHYDENGNVATEEIYGYDDEGRLKEILFKQPDGLLQQRTVFSFDARGRRYKEERYNLDGTLRLKITYGYDLLGRLLEESLYDEEGLFKLRWNYSYNNDGLRVREELYTGRGIRLPGPVVTEYAYDDAGNVREAAHRDAGGDVMERVVYSYDENRNVIEETSYDAKGFLLGTTFTSYTYDKEGNWTSQRRTKRLGRRGVRPLGVIYRTITYFDRPGETQHTAENRR